MIIYRKGSRLLFAFTTNDGFEHSGLSLDSSLYRFLQLDEKLHSHTGRGGARLIPALERWRQEDQGVQSQPWLLGQLRRGKGSVDSCLLMGWTKTGLSPGDF